MKAGHEFITRAMDEIGNRASAITSNPELEDVVREDINIRISNWLATATTVSRGGGLLGYKEQGGRRRCLTGLTRERKRFIYLSY